MAFCSKCGSELSANASFCGGCGAASIEKENTQAAQTSSQPSPVSGDESLELFIGKNYDYFTRKWAIAEQKKSKQSWNWAAFLLGFAWMAYRKMYLYSWIFIGVIIVEILCEYAFNLPDKLSNAINIGIAVTFGWQGNYLYKLHAEKKIKEITAMNSPEQAKIELAKQGGTNIGAAIGFVVALAAIMLLVIVVAEQQI